MYWERNGHTGDVPHQSNGNNLCMLRRKILMHCLYIPNVTPLLLWTTSPAFCRHLQPQVQSSNYCSERRTGLTNTAGWVCSRSGALRAAPAGIGQSERADELNVWPVSGQIFPFFMVVVSGLFSFLPLWWQVKDLTSVWITCCPHHPVIRLFHSQTNSCMIKGKFYIKKCQLLWDHPLPSPSPPAPTIMPGSMSP